MNSKDLTIEIIKEFWAECSKEELEKLFINNIYENEVFLKIWNDNKEEIGRMFNERTKPETFYPFAKRLIVDLSEKYNLFIVSGAPTKKLVNHLDLIESTSFFNEILGCDVSMSKVDRFKMIFERGFDKDDCLFITDSLGDIKEANEVELNTIGVVWGMHDELILQKGNPCFIAKDVNELEQYISNNL